MNGVTMGSLGCYPPMPSNMVCLKIPFKDGRFNNGKINEKRMIFQQTTVDYQRFVLLVIGVPINGN